MLSIMNCLMERMKNKMKKITIKIKGDDFDILMKALTLLMDKNIDNSELWCKIFDLRYYIRREAIEKCLRYD